MCKRLLSLLAVVALFGLLADSVSAQMAQFKVSRDNTFKGWSDSDTNNPLYSDGTSHRVFNPDRATSEWSNRGVRQAIRVKKHTEESTLLDWDTEVINTWIAANVGPGQSAEVTLNLYPFDSTLDQPLQIYTFESLNDWTEGDGTGRFNWTPGTGAATQNYAQTFYTFDAGLGDDVLDEVNSVPWLNDEDGSVFSVLDRTDGWESGLVQPNFINSASISAADYENAEFAETFVSVVLDDVVVDALLNDPNNRGLFFGGSGEANDNRSNARIWTREGSGLDDGFGGPGLADPVDWPGPVSPFLTVRVVAGPLLAGDFDNDGDIDGVDFLAWQRDRSVGNLSDWRSGFGMTSVLPAVTMTPEPSAWMLLAIGLGLWLSFLRCRAPLSCQH